MNNNDIKNLIPKRVKVFIKKYFNFIVQLYSNLQIQRLINSQKNIVVEFRRKEKLNVIFLVFLDSVWKYDQVYRLLQADNKFEVKIVVIPLVKGEQADMKVYNKTLNYFLSHNYKVVSSYDHVSNNWLDIKNLTQPDIVFFSSPYSYTFGKYYIDNFIDKLTCYVPYAFVVIHSIEMHYNQRMHHLLWKYFVETKYHQEFAKEYSKYKQKNIQITGYPGLDGIYRPNYKPKSVWKKNNDSKKIIWAPHHTIYGQGSGLDYSSFMKYSEYFIGLLEAKNNIQIAFKPHPLLKEKLYTDEQWGKEKTDKYYQKWDELPNGQLEEGDYIDLFASSDAMILDSASFMAEYLYTRKPSLFTKRDNEIEKRFNDFGKLVFQKLYQAETEKEIIKFIEDVVIAGNDYMYDERNNFFTQVVLPLNNKTASENIYNELIKELT